MAVEKKTVEPQAPVAVAPKDEMTAYYCGLTDECPLDFITMPTVAQEGAPAFCKYTQKALDRGDGIATEQASTASPEPMLRPVAFAARDDLDDQSVDAQHVDDGPRRGDGHPRRHDHVRQSRRPGGGFPYRVPR